MAAPTIVTVTLNPAVDRVLEAPRFGVGKHVSSRQVAHYPAGKGVIVSRVLATLGVRSVATGFVGRNELAMFEEHLERVGEGLTVCQFLIVRARTRDNITIVDPIEDTETHIRDEGFTVQPEDVTRMMSKVGLLARRGTIMAFCGSLPPGLDPSSFAAMVRRCSEQGARVIVDTSGEALRGLKGVRLWMAKLNAHELSVLSNQETDSDEQFRAAARELSAFAGGPVEHVVATRGAEGAVLYSQDVALVGRVSVHPGRIVSSVGCGDALLAGMLCEWVRSGNWRAALTKGLAVATANAVNREAGLVLEDDIAEFEEMAMIEDAE
jgi:1-phosphofructokinase family hexose kinase